MAPSAEEPVLVHLLTTQLGGFPEADLDWEAPLSIKEGVPLHPPPTLVSKGN